MSNIKVIGLGALNMDHLYRVERILTDGETVVKEPILAPGGSAANTIFGLARLGVSTGFAGATGDDEEGRMLVQDLAGVGVDTGQIRVKAGAKTGATLCLSDRHNSRSIYIMPGANSLLTSDDLALTYINRAEFLHISSFADEAQFAVLLKLIDRLAPSVKLSFSPGALYAAKGLQTLAPVLARTYILFVNQSEIRQLTGQDVSPGAQSCLERGCRMVAVTLGPGARWQNVMAASYIRDTEDEYIVEPGKTDGASALDTTGAGDAFATGFIYGQLRGKGPGECGELGHTVARCSIAKVGARPGLPTQNELSRRYRELYNKEL